MSAARPQSETGAATATPDPGLARRAAGGDEGAFAEIFDRYHQRLYRYCLALVGNPQDAQDALQNTMVKVLRALPGEQRQIELKPWLYRIAHNESIELLRRRRETRPLDAELVAPGSGVSAEVDSRERLRQLLADLEELPERQRGALVMRELAGLGFAEIGAALETSDAVARQTVYEARLGLRQMDRGREMDCEKVTRALSEGDGRVTRRRDVRAHLRACPSCRRFGDEIDARKGDFAALSPLPAAVAASLLQGMLGGVGSSLAGALGGGAAKSLGSSALLKGAATVAVAAAIGAGAADRGGLIHIGPQGNGGSPTAPATAPSEEGSPKSSEPSEIAASTKADVPSGSARKASGVGAGAAKDVSAGQGQAPAQADTHAEPEQVEGSAGGGKSAAHPHGRGHEKQLPAASTHGQQTAAAKKAEHGTAGNKGHQAHQPKPPHPATPATDNGSPPKTAPTSEPPAQENAGGQPASREEPVPGESGKKP